MADEEKNESTEETPEETPAEEPAAEAEEAPAEEAPAEEPAAEEPQGEEAADEPAAEQPAADTGTPGGAAEDVAGGDSEEAPEKLSPKQLRKAARSQHTGEARPERSPEERASERAAERSRLAGNRRRRRSKERHGRTAGTGTPAAEREPGSKRVRQGKVVSDRADKTITVQVEVVRRHPVYEKVIRRSTTIHAHDERNEAHAGDVVRVIESRPLSRTKRWRLVEVLERAR